MVITEVRIRPSMTSQDVDGLAGAVVVLDGQLAVDGFRILSGVNGPYVAAHELVRALSPAVKDQIHRAILEAYSNQVPTARQYPGRPTYQEPEKPYDKSLYHSNSAQAPVPAR